MPKSFQSRIKNLEAEGKVLELIVLLKNHESILVRERVVRALGRLKDSHTIDPLISIFEDKAVISHAAVWALSKIGAPAVEPLITTLNESKKKGKHAAETLGKIKDPRAIKPLIETFNKSNIVSKAAVCALTKIGKPAVSPLIEALYKSNNKLRYAAETLGLIGESKAIEPLIQVFKVNLHSNKLRMIIAQALERLSWNPPINELGAHYYISLGDWNKLEEIGAYAINPIMDSLDNLYNLTGSRATQVLGNIEDTNAVLPLIKYLRHESHFIRANVARALGNIGDFRAIKPLIALLDDEYSRQDSIYGNKWDDDSEMINYTVRNAAVAALRKIAGGTYSSDNFTKEYEQKYWNEEKEFWQQWYESKREIRKEKEIYGI